MYELRLQNIMTGFEKRFAKAAVAKEMIVLI